MDQKQVILGIDALIRLIELLEHASDASGDMETNALIVMHDLDRLLQLLGVPSAGCEGQTAFAVKEDVQ